MTATTTTVNDLDPVAQYTASAGQTIFDAPWLFFEDADLTVYHTLSGVDADDTADLLTLTTDYTVTNAGVQAGGEIVLNTGAAVGDIITIYRIVSVERTADYQTSGDMLAETINKEQDTEIMIAQQLRADIDNRAFLLQRSEDVNIDTEIPTPEASKIWGWNSAGTGIEYYNNPDDAVTAAEASAAAALVSENNAAASEAAAEAIFDNFDDAYLGSKASDPTLDNDGNALSDGALYYNTSSNDLRVYDLGTTTWIVFPTTTISALTDVTLTSIASGELLKWDGSKWINNTLAEAGIASTSDVANVSPIGKQTIYIPAAAMISRKTAGAALNHIETSTYDVNVMTMDFDAATDELIQFAVQMPKGWNESTLTAQFVWSHPATTVNFGVRFFIGAISKGDGDPIDESFGSVFAHPADTGGVTDTIYITPETTIITVTNAGESEWVAFQVYRDVSDAGDTLAVDARLHGVSLFYTTDAATDA